jgi:hypothetical protein
MSYSLKVDWSGLRINEVYAALGMNEAQVFMTAEMDARRELRAVLRNYLDVAGSVTLKLSLTRYRLDVLEVSLASAITALTKDMLRARDNLPGPSYEDLVVSQTQVFAALQDIQSYREATRLAVRLAELGY